MTQFSEYSHIYDILYREKDYAAEATYVIDRLNDLQASNRTLLELGCGTGRHALALAQMGYSVTGVDLSADMLTHAWKRLENAPQEIRKQVEFVQGNVQSFSTDRVFDAVISLFHVLSYQITNTEVCAMLNTAARHLRPGGLLLMDFWYGPAVLHLRPEDRDKEIKTDELTVRRHTRSSLFTAENRVDVHFDTVAVDRNGSIQLQSNETHQIRYFFLPELELFLSICGFRLLRTEEWLSGLPPGEDTWGVCLTAERL